MKHWRQIEPHIGELPLAKIPMVLRAAFGSGSLFNWSGNEMELLYLACYGCLILYFAYGTREVRRGFDTGYGVYAGKCRSSISRCYRLAVSSGCNLHHHWHRRCVVAAR